MKSFCRYVLPVCLLLGASVRTWADTGIHSQLDSLYTSFEAMQKKGYVQEANKIMELMGDDYAFPESMSWQEANSILLDKYVDYYRSTSDFEGRLSYLDKALRFYVERGDSMNVARSYHTLGATYQLLGLYERAIESYNSSSEILTLIGGDGSQMRYRYTLNNIAALFFEEGNLDKSEELYLKCLSLINDQENEFRNQIDRSTYLGNLAMVYNAKAEESVDADNVRAFLATAKEYGEQAVKIARESCDGTDWEGEIVKRSLPLARTLMLQGQVRQAEAVLKVCDGYIARRSLEYQGVQVIGIRAEIEALRGNVHEAERLYSQVCDYSSSHGLKEMESEALENLYEVLKDRNPAKALECLEKRSAIRDSVLTLQQNVLISDFNARYENKEKETLIMQQEAEIRHSKTVTSALAVILILCVALAAGIYGHVITVRRTNRELQESNSTKDRMISIISHDLKNPVYAQRNALRGLHSSYKALDRDTLGTYVEELLNSSESQVQLLGNLLDWARLQTGRLGCTMAEFNLSAVVSTELRTIRNMADNKGLDIRAHLTADDEVHADRTMISIVFRNLLTNAVKFSRTGGTVEVETSLDGDKIRCSVRDHGVGMDADRLAQIFTYRESGISSGTFGEPGTGLGLELCKTFVEMNGGSIEASSSEGEGSAFTFYLKRSQS